MAGVASATSLAVAQDSPRVAAASDLKFALDEIAVAYRQEAGAPVTVVYGSSGTSHDSSNRVRRLSCFSPLTKDSCSNLLTPGLHGIVANFMPRGAL